MAVKQTAGRDTLGEFAPKFAQLNDDVLFGEVWSREGQLSLRDRSLVTGGGADGPGAGGQLLPVPPDHRQAKRHHPAGDRGNSDPRGLLRRLAQGLGRLPHGQGGLGRRHGRGRQGAAPARDGIPHRRSQRRLRPIFRGAELPPAPLHQPGGRVQRHLEPGCRNNWHIHHASQGGGQILLCVAGRGWYQEWGQTARELHPGDVVNIPAGVKHWHGAAADSWFSHLAVEVPGEGCSNEWLEAISDAAYGQLK